MIPCTFMMHFMQFCCGVGWSASEQKSDQMAVIKVHVKDCIFVKLQFCGSHLAVYDFIHQHLKMEVQYGLGHIIEWCPF